MDSRRGINNCTRWWVVVLVMLSARFPGVLAWYCSAADRDTLLSFSAGFVDAGGVFSSWNASTNCCTWAGVQCSESDGAVLALTLVGDQRTFRNSRFGGEVGAGLVRLTSLQQLTIQGVRLDEPIPSEWGEFSNNLLVIVINNANLFGNIPPSLASISNLQTLDVRSNHLTGNIPTEFCNQNNFKYIDVSFNNMNYVPVPRCLQEEDVIVIYNNQSPNIGPPGLYPPSGPNLYPQVAQIGMQAPNFLSHQLSSKQPLLLSLCGLFCENI